MALSKRALHAKPIISCETELGNHLKCNACSHILVNGFQTRHGCRLCQDCVANKLDKTKRRLCPCTPGPYNFRDEDEITELLVNQMSCYPDTAARLDVSKLTVHCPNTECPERMEWREVDKHLNEKCNFELVTCKLCHEQIVCHQLRADNHYNLDSENCCIRFRGSCPLCGDATSSLSRDDFVEHKKSCSKRQIKCKYSPIGCSLVTSCEQMDEHYRDCTDTHLHMTVERVCCGSRVAEETQPDQLNAIRHQREQESVQCTQEFKQMMEHMLGEMEQKITLRLKGDLQELVQNELAPKLKGDLQELVQNELAPKLKGDLQELVQKEVKDKLEKQEGRENPKPQELNTNLKEREINMKAQELNESPKLKPEESQEEQEMIKESLKELKQELMKVNQKLPEVENIVKKLLQKLSRQCMWHLGVVLDESEEPHQLGETPQVSSTKVVHEWRNTTRKRTKSTSLF